MANIVLIVKLNAGFFLFQFQSREIILLKLVIIYLFL